MKGEQSDNSSITQRASEWFFTLPKASADEQAAFGAWLKESPRHVEEFLLVSAAYRELEHASAETSAELESLRGELRARVVPLARHSSSPTTDSSKRADALGARAKFATRPMSRLSSAAILLGVTIAIGWWVYGKFLSGETYATATGELRSLELKDGSLVQLNTRSQVKVDFSAAARDIQLVSGEAAFKVAHDSTRPFRVHTGSAVIQAIGTEFNVYRRATDTVVSVLEGTVRVSNAPEHNQVLRAGQEIHVATNGALAQPEKSDIAKATAWRQRRLVFHGDSLAEVAAEFNRYNRTPQIRVQGELARSKPLAGIFDANDPESLVQFLAGVDDLKTEREADEVIISGRER